MEAPALTGIRVIDLGGSVTCLVATLVLAEAGCGDGRAAGRFRAAVDTGVPNVGRSKRSVVLDLACDDGRRQLDDLLAHTDVLVHSIMPSVARALGLDDASLAACHPQLIVSSVLAWPANHAWADTPVDDQLTLAGLGVLDEQLGRRDGPIYVRFPLGTWPAAWLAAIGIMSRLASRGRTGAAGPAHTSLAQGALIPMMMPWSRADTPSDNLATSSAPASPVPCRVRTTPIGTPTETATASS